MAKPRKAGLNNIDYIHDLIHRGLYFSVFHTFKSVSDDAFAYMRIKTGAVEIHPIFMISSTGLAYASVYREADVSGGTPLLITHHKDDDDRRAIIDTLFYHTPTVGSSPGTLWVPDRLIQGSTGPKSTGSQIGGREEMYLKPNHEYLIAVENVAGAAKDIEIAANFYPYHIVE